MTLVEKECDNPHQWSGRSFYIVFFFRETSVDNAGAVVRVSSIVSLSKVYVMHILVRTHTGNWARLWAGSLASHTYIRHVSISRLSSVRALHENMGQAAVAYLQPRSSATPRSSGHDSRSVSSTIDQLKNRLSRQAVKNSRTDKSIL